MKPKSTSVYHVWAPRIGAHKLIRVIKKIVQKTQTVPSSSLIYCNNYGVVDIEIKTIKKKVKIEFTIQCKQSI